MAANNDRHLSIRRATPTDADRVAALTDAAYATYVPRLGRKPQPMSQDYRRMLEGPQPVWLLALDGREAGVLVLRRDPDALLIYSVAIDPPCQGQGLGRALLAWAEQEARRAGYDKIRLYTNALMVENMALYIHLGYRETSREAYLGSTLVHFCKELGS